MCIFGFPWFLMVAGVVLTVVCSVGEVGPVLYNEILRKIGFFGMGAMLLYVFSTYCSIVAVQFVIPLIFVALITRLIVWIVVKRTEPDQNIIGRV